MRKAAQTKMANILEAKVRESGELGLKGQKDAKRRLREKAEREFNIMQAGNERSIRLSPHVLQSTNINRLLTKKWSERPNAFRLMSQIRKRSDPRKNGWTTPADRVN